MSEASTVVFFGVRLRVADSQIESVEDRTHPVVVQARRNGLQLFHDNFGIEQKEYLLFIGANIAVMGLENDRSRSFTLEDLEKRISETRIRLVEANIPGEPLLWLEWLPGS